MLSPLGLFGVLHGSVDERPLLLLLWLVRFFLLPWYFFWRALEFYNLLYLFVSLLIKMIIMILSMGKKIIIGKLIIHFFFLKRNEIIELKEWFTWNQTCVTRLLKPVIIAIRSKSAPSGLLSIWKCVCKTANCSSANVVRTRFVLAFCCPKLIN